MARSGIHAIQRLLAREFERRGWSYDAIACRAIAEALAESPTSDLSQAINDVDRYVLCQRPPSRAEVTSAVESVRTSISRVNQIGEQGRMRLLFAAAGPEDEGRLRLAAEHRDIREAVRAATNREGISIEATLAARPQDLINELNRFKPTILHLAGHGGTTGIALEDAEGFASDVTTDQLTQLVALADPALRLVVLNSCESASQAEPIAEKVGAAIGMTRKIGDDAARTFAVQLYSSLGEGVPLDRAFEQSRLQISLTGLAENETPRLFVRPGIDAADLQFSSQ